jgi:RHS repeat-associated protein
MLADSTNTIVWEGIYKPFGEADVNPNSSVVNNFRFPGQYYDAETGLHYNYFRYYDPSTGRYLTPDPIGLLGGINLFEYSENNSINVVDPFGLIVEADPYTAANQSIIKLPKIKFFGEVDPRSLKPGADSSTGPLAFYGAGTSLIITGAAVTKAGVEIMVLGGPVGLIGGGIVTIVGGTIWITGVGTVYQGYQLDVQENTLLELSPSDSFWGTGIECEN